MGIEQATVNGSADGMTHSSDAPGGPQNGKEQSLPFCGIKNLPTHEHYLGSLDDRECNRSKMSFLVLNLRPSSSSILESLSMPGFFFAPA